MSLLLLSIPPSVNPASVFVLALIGMVIGGVLMLAGRRMNDGGEQ